MFNPRTNPALLLRCILAILLFSAFSFFPSEAIAQNQTLTSSPKQETSGFNWHSVLQRFHLELTGESISHPDLRKTYESTPGRTNTPFQKNQWVDNWKEYQFYGTVLFDLIKDDTFLLSPGINLGLGQGDFNAHNNNINYYESWLTKNALLAGVSLQAELRTSPHEGLFLRFRYDSYPSEAGESQERVIPEPQFQICNMPISNGKRRS